MISDDAADALSYRLERDLDKLDAKYHREHKRVKRLEEVIADIKEATFNRRTPQVIARLNRVREILLRFDEEETQ